MKIAKGMPMTNKLFGAGVVCAVFGLFSVVGIAQADPAAAAVAPAATTAPAAAGAPAAMAAATPDPLDKMVCRMQPPPLGTRIGREAICQTQREWNTMESGTQSRFHEVQMRNTMGNPGNNGSE